MSTVMARRVAATPMRNASQTWGKIVDLIAPDPKSAARSELAKVAGIACSSIASEATKDAAIVMWGGGPRVRFYCLFDEDAITGDDLNEDALPLSPIEGNWKMSIPCMPEDVAWSQKKLGELSARVTARSIDDDVEEEKQETTTKAAMTINLSEFLKS